MSASEGVAELGPEEAPKGGGKPGIAMVGAPGREASVRGRKWCGRGSCI